MYKRQVKRRKHRNSVCVVFNKHFTVLHFGKRFLPGGCCVSSARVKWALQSFDNTRRGLIMMVSLSWRWAGRGNEQTIFSFESQQASERSSFRSGFSVQRLVGGHEKRRSNEAAARMSARTHATLFTSWLTDRARITVPVSYTHLDVYKRQI